MHYRNGREAKNGDKVVLIPTYGAPLIGILYDAQAGNDTCNGKIAPISPTDPMPNLKEVLHLDDVKAAVAKGVLENKVCPRCFQAGPNGGYIDGAQCKNEWHTVTNESFK